MSYNKKILLGNLLNIPTDSSLMGANIASLQARYLAPQGPEQAAGSRGPGRPRSTTKGKELNQSGRLETEAQRVARKED